eukprot:g3472.t1
MVKLVCVNECENPTLRIICFPSAGGSAKGFSQCKRFAEERKKNADESQVGEIEFWVVEYPLTVNNTDVNAFFTDTFDSLVAQRMFAKVPFALMGHSMGGLMAYEFALYLAQLRDYAAVIQPTAVVVCSTLCSGHIPFSSYTDLKVDQLINRGKKLGWFEYNDENQIDDPSFRSTLVAFLKVHLRLYEALLTTYQQTKSSDDIYPSFPYPLVVIAGEDDPMIHPRFATVNEDNHEKVDDKLSGFKNFLASWQTVNAHVFKFHKVLGMAHMWNEDHFNDILTFIYETIPTIQPIKSCVSKHLSDFRQNWVAPDVMLPNLWNDDFVMARANDIAIVYDNGQKKLTYTELNDRILKLSYKLRVDFGIGESKSGIEEDQLKRELRVATYLPVCLDLVVALMAIWRAGGSQVYLFPSYTHEFVKIACKRSSCALILTQSQYKEKVQVPNTSTLYLDDPMLTFPDLPSQKTFPQNPVGPNDEASVSFTSGSSGMPKPVSVPHRSFALTYYARKDIYPYKVNEQEACCTFFNWEFFRPLLSGVTLHIIPDAMMINPRKWIEYFQKNNITRVVHTPSHLNSILQFEPSKRLEKMRYFIVVGEGIPSSQILSFYRIFSTGSTKLVNFYSSWEGLDAGYMTLTPTHGKLEIVPTRLCPGVTIMIVGKNNQILPRGFVGEVLAAGHHVSLGFVKAPDTDTVEQMSSSSAANLKFIDNPFPESVSAKAPQVVYKSGDLGRILPDGSLHLLGRMGTTIKVRGFKLSLNLIERQINATPGVIASCTKVIYGDNRIPKEISAYILGGQKQEEKRDSENNFDENNVKSDGIYRIQGSRLRIDVAESLRKALPSYAIPKYIIHLNRFPIRAGNNKIDKKRLPEPSQTDVVRATTANQTFAPKSDLETKVLQCWCSVLDIDSPEIVSKLHNFFEEGGHSLNAAQLTEMISETLDIQLEVLDLFENPTLEGLISRSIRLLEMNHPSTPLQAINQDNHTSNKKLLGSKVAIIGMAGKFPGADNVDEFWKNLCEEHDSLRHFDKNELRRLHKVDSDLINNPNFVPVGQVVEGADLFDAFFWGISAKEARRLDPQQRLFLQCAWNAVENAGYAPATGDFSHHPGEKREKYRTGVFAACGIDGYLINHIGGDALQDLSDPSAIFNTEVGNEKDYISTRVSYKMNLRGPSMTVNSACSSGLVAVAQALQAIQLGQCEAAIAGASSLTFPNFGYMFSEGLVGSKDGHVRPFCEHASGTLFGDGVGAILLKRLDLAIIDGDPIKAVISGYSVTNDGSEKAGYAAPNSDAQCDAVVDAMNMANVKSEDMSYVECHATATLVGDAIEIRGLKEAYRQMAGDPRDLPSHKVALGSVKGNIGHANCAAGITGLIKTALCIEKKTLVPTANFTKLNKKINFSGTGFYVNTKTKPWDLDSHAKQRRAGVSSFGVGGTNVHIVLEEYSSAEETNGSLEENETTDLSSSSSPSTTAQYHMITLSGKTMNSVIRTANKLGTYLLEHPKNVRDVAYTLHVGRENFNHRVAFVIKEDKEEVPTTDASIISERLLSISDKDVVKCSQPSTNEKDNRVVFVFPGQGTQYPGMASQMYEYSATFRNTFDFCCDYLTSLNEKYTSLKSIMFGTESEKLIMASFVQPAIFIVEYCLAKTLIDRGVIPVAVGGHSIGEYVAATVAGILQPEDALQMIMLRGQITQDYGKEGTMLSVKGDYNYVNDLLSSASIHLCTAALNAPEYSVFAGSIENVSKASKILTAKGIRNMRLHVNKAFHSDLMNEAAQKFASAINLLNIKYKTAKIPMTSNVTGSWLQDGDLSPAYWRKHMNSTVHWNENAVKILEGRPRIILEVGLGQVLCKLLSKQPKELHPQKMINVLPNAKEYAAGDRVDSLKYEEAFAEMWKAGIHYNWQAYHAAGNQVESRGLRTSLSGYQFEEKSFWQNPEKSIYVKPTAERAKKKRNKIVKKKKADNRWNSSVLVPTHIVKDTKGKPRVSIFCFPYAGGSSRAFDNWTGEAQVCNALCDIVCIELPQRRARAEVPMPETVDKDDVCIMEIAQAIDSFVTQSKTDHVVFCGMSMGALIALHVASTLTQTLWKDSTSPVLKGFVIIGRAPLSYQQDSLEVTDELINSYSLSSTEVMTGNAWVQYQLPLLKADLQFDHRLAKRAQLMDFKLPDSCKLQICVGKDDPSFEWYKGQEWAQILKSDDGQQNVFLDMFPGAHNFMKTHALPIFRKVINLHQIETGSRSELSSKRFHQQTHLSINPLHHLELCLKKKIPKGESLSLSTCLLSSNSFCDAKLVDFLNNKGRVLMIDYSRCNLDNPNPNFPASHDMFLKNEKVFFDHFITFINSLSSFIEEGLISTLSSKNKIRIVLVCSSNSHTCTGALVAGASRSVDFEFPFISCQRIFISDECATSDLQLVLDDLPLEPEIYVSHSTAQKNNVLKVHVPRLTADTWDPTDPAVNISLSEQDILNTVFDDLDDGAFILSGGLGALGSQVVEYLVSRRVPPKNIILLTRRAKEFLPSTTRPDVTIVTVDCANGEALLKNETLQKLKKVNAIFHLAGFLDDGIFGKMTVERLDKTLRPKKAIFDLAHASAKLQWNTSLIFAFSSVTSLLGYGGQANYSASNALLDNIAMFGSKFLHGIPIVSCNWGPWKEVGMSKIGTKAYDLSIAAGDLPLPTKMALDCIDHLLAHMHRCKRNTDDSFMNHSAAIFDAKYNTCTWTRNPMLSSLCKLETKLKPSTVVGDANRHDSINSEDGDVDGHTIGDEENDKADTLGEEDIDSVEMFLRNSLSVWDISLTLAELGFDSLDEVDLRNSFIKTFDRNAPLSLFSAPNQNVGSLLESLQNIVKA